MIHDLVIKNGTIVTSETTYQADVAIIGETIATIGTNLTGARELDATDKYVIPGAIDVHVHLEMPIGNFVSSDTFLSGTRAAAFGGTTAIIDFVETQPKQTMIDALNKRKDLASSQAVIDYGFHMTIGPTDISKLDQLSAVYEAGCSSFKLYMAYGLRLHDGELLQALQAVHQVGGLPVVHAENWDIICTHIDQNLAQGHTSPHWHPRCRPAFIEGTAVQQIINIATYVGSPLYIFHVGCADAVEKIAQARQRNLPIMGETCPQYLYLTEAVYDYPGVKGALPVCSPPLRTETDQTRVWQALARNELQVVSTDHCPFTSEEKAFGLHQSDFSQIPGGVPSIEVRLSAIYQGVQQGYLSLNRWVDVCCTTPADLFGFANKGRVAVGYEADLVIFDPKKIVTLSTETLHEQVDWTPYNNLHLMGWPSYTLSRGDIIVENGTFIGEAGRGRFVKRRNCG